MAKRSIKQSLETAHRLAPWDGRIAGALAGALSNGDVPAADRRRADALARSALRSAPAVVPAVAALGLNASVRGDEAAARRLFGYARKLSRRDVVTQLWAIEDAVGRGDVAGALGAYDVALRGRPALADVLFPVLLSASADATIRRELIRTMSKKPAWAEAFVGYVAAAKGTDARAMATLFAGLERAGIDVSDGAHATAVNGLLSAGFVEQAWTHYAVARPGAARDRSRDESFSADLTTPSRFDWEPADDGVVTTSVRNGAFDFSAPSGVGGRLLQQLQLLGSGRYRLTGRSVGIEQVGAERPYWTLLCSDGRELGRVAVPPSAEAGGRFAGAFTVPSGCSMQTLAFVAVPSDRVGGLSGQIEQVQLEPLKP